MSKVAPHAKYVAELSRLLHEPETVDEVAEELGAPAAPGAETRQALKFYTNGARWRRMGFVDQTFPRFMKALDDESRKDLEQAFISAPSGGDWDWGLNANRFLEVVQQLVQEHRLPPAAGELATHQWALFEVTLAQHPGEPWQDLERLAINPTFDARQYARDVTTGKLEPESAKPVLVGYYIHPELVKPRWLKLDDSVFARMRVVDEGIPYARAAAEAGITEDELGQKLEELALLGLFVNKP